METIDQAVQEALWTAISDVVLVLDSQGRYRKIVPANPGLLAKPPAELMDQTLHDVFPAAQADTFLGYIRHALATGQTVSAEYALNLPNRDGETWFAATISPISDGTVVWVARDINERKRLEEQLRQSQKMQIIGQLAAGAVHDFNNLLTIIGGYTQLLLRVTPSDHPHHQDLKRISKTTDRAATLIRQLLAFVRREATQSIMLNLNDVLTDLFKLLGRVMGSDITLITSLAPDLDWVRADPGQIEQVLLNLVVNARDAMPAGGQLIIETANITLTNAGARTSTILEPGAYIRLTVTDTGMGMDDEIRAHIFEPFFTTKPTDQGTGLGLAVVLNVIKEHKGHIDVSSKPGSGTTFRIYLPACQPSSPDLSADTSKLRAQPAGPPPGNATILLVEDEPLIRELIQVTLEISSYTVLSAADARQAIELFQTHQHRIALLISDVGLPDSSGPALYQTLFTKTPSLKVLFISGYSGDRLQHYGLTPGVPFLQKPFTLPDLIKKVREVLDRR